jgi:hypothetical protein
MEPGKLHSVFIVVLLMIHLNTAGAGERNPAGSRAGAMGGTSVALSDGWSVSNNPAGTAWLIKPGTGVWFEDRFLVSDLMFFQGYFIQPVKQGCLGLTVSHFGNEHYGELKAGVTYAMRFGKRLSAGVMLDVNRIQVSEGYGNRNLLSMEVGLQYRISNHFWFGLHVLNPIPVRMVKSTTEYLPVVFCAGLNYSISNTFRLTLEGEKDLEHRPMLRLGAEYDLPGRTVIRAGISTNPLNLAMGFGVVLGRLSLEIASGYHQYLGYTPSCSLAWRLGAK